MIPDINIIDCFPGLRELIEESNINESEVYRYIMSEMKVNIFDHEKTSASAAITIIPTFIVKQVFPSTPNIWPKEGEVLCFACSCCEVELKDRLRDLKKNDKNTFDNITQMLLLDNISISFYITDSRNLGNAVWCINLCDLDWEPMTVDQLRVVDEETVLNLTSIIRSSRAIYTETGKPIPISRSQLLAEYDKIQKQVYDRFSSRFSDQKIELTTT